MEQIGQADTGPQRSYGRTVALVIIAFLILAGLQIWWQRAEQDDRPGVGEVTVPRTQIASEDRQLEIGSDTPGSEVEREQVRREGVRRALTTLRRSAHPSERRSAALRLSYLADSSAEGALVMFLRDSDEVVSQRCADALLGLWQRSDSPRVNQFFQQGLAAYNAGDYEQARELFDTCVRLDPSVPDVYRLRAEILLAMDRPADAARECRSALRLKQEHFLAHCVLAECHLRLRDGQAALESVETALSIYGGLERARQLKEEILSLQKAGEL